MTHVSTYKKYRKRTIPDCRQEPTDGAFGRPALADSPISTKIQLNSSTTRLLNSKFDYICHPHYPDIFRMLLSPVFQIRLRQWRTYCLLILGLIGLAGTQYRCSRYSTPPRVLIFTKTMGFRHASIPTAVAAVQKVCSEQNIKADHSEDATLFNEKNLQRYAAVIFLSTTGDVLDPKQEVAFERYIQAGGGFVGIHAATDTEYGWGWFTGLVGGQFESHPEIQSANLHIRDHQHLSTRHLSGNIWTRKDEWYNFKNFNPKVNLLLSLDETSYKGGTMCTPPPPPLPDGTGGGGWGCHPAAWYHEYDGGRAWYTAGGHTEEAFAEPEFLKHIVGGIHYAIGKNGRLDYTKCRTHAVPDPTRFVKTTLATDLNEPMEFDMLPEGKVLIVERRGAMKMFDPASGQLSVVYQMPVHSEFEDGLMGLALDPNYEKNHWIYMYYSPIGESCNQLSRFVFERDQLDVASEKVILKVNTQRRECCHAGGSITFDDQGNLFLSAGDNTNPFASDGYSPSDETPGRSPWDAQQSSANTNDLRGKVMRIRPLPDGSYICPQGNLFNAGSDLHITEGPLPNESRLAENKARGGRPEVYVMGCRNPFRISYDNRRDYLFWGEVGPDAGEPDSTRGPQGHDEVNRARAAGFFGWPFFVGNNKPYGDHNFVTKKTGAKHDPLHPINDSPNNTGARELPPAQSAFIWYPYANSQEFPLVRNGGRNAMAGPVYYCDQYPEKTRFPQYFDGKLIIYDWMRNWMMAVEMDSLGNFSRMEPFADSIELSRPMDMFVDKNGSLWVLEYGTQWFSSNPDARLSRIDYVRGNRPPKAVLNADELAGAAPLEVNFDFSKTRDYDNDMLKYDLDFKDGSGHFNVQNRPTAHASATSAATEKTKLRTKHVFAQPGTYEVTLRVTDPSGALAISKKTIRVGNAEPEVAWDLGGHNRSFYKPGTTINYAVQVNDLEDGTLATGHIVPASVAATIDYLQEGFDMTLIAQGHQTAASVSEYARGKILTEKSDCKTCHAVDRRVNGPSYQDIAQRYRGDEFAVNTLTGKVIKGGAGNWGETVMSAHPQLPPEDVAEMVRWILSLGDPSKAPGSSLALAGQYPLVTPPAKEKGKPSFPGTYILRANYKDRGSPTQTSLEGGEILALRPAFQQAEQADSMSSGILHYRPGNGDTVVLRDMKDGAFLMYKRCDLAGIQGISVGFGGSDKYLNMAGGSVEVRIDSPKGKLLGESKLEAPTKAGGRMRHAEVTVPIAPGHADGRFHNLFIIVRNPKSPSESVAAIDWVRFEL
jgi:cytochrome c